MQWNCLQDRTEGYCATAHCDRPCSWLRSAATRRGEQKVTFEIVYLPEAGGRTSRARGAARKDPKLQDRALLQEMAEQKTVGQLSHWASPAEGSEVRLEDWSKATQECFLLLRLVARLDRAFEIG